MTKEQHNPTLWSSKALKQLVKLPIQHAHKEQYIRDYQCLLAVVEKGEIPPNAMEKGMHTMLDRLPSEGAVYDATITLLPSNNGGMSQQMTMVQNNAQIWTIVFRFESTCQAASCLERLVQIGK